MEIIHQSYLHSVNHLNAFHCKHPMYLSVYVKIYTLATSENMIADSVKICQRIEIYFVYRKMKLNMP